MSTEPAGERSTPGAGLSELLRGCELAPQPSTTIRQAAGPATEPCRRLCDTARKMFKVIVKGEESFFPSLKDAMAYAQKESYINACEATVVTPDGDTIPVKL